MQEKGGYKMDKLSEAFLDLTEQPKVESTVVNGKKVHFVAQYIIHFREGETGEILNCVSLPLVGGLGNESYFDECAHCAEVDDIVNNVELPPGVYRVTVTGQCDGSVSSGPWGTEYDAWETYDIIEAYRYPDKEAQYVIRDYEELNNE